jgi:hypothetical protein
VSTATISARRNQNIYRSQARLQLGPTSVGFVTVAIITVLALLYLTQITKTSVYGYKLSDLSQKQAKLSLAQQELEVEAARLQAIATIQNAPVVTKMVTEQSVTYAN